MAVTISKEIASIADISVKVYPARLTTRQQTSLAKQIRTGVVRGNAAPAQLALVLLQQHNLPHIHLRRYGYIQWRNVPLDPKHPLREALMAAHAASCMDRHFDDKPKWQMQRGMLSVGDRVRQQISSTDWTALSKSARDAAC